jgi:aminotransferase
MRFTSTQPGRLVRLRMRNNLKKIIHSRVPIRHHGAKLFVLYDQGHERLRQIVAKFYSFLMRRKLDPEKELVITTGSLQAMELAAKSFINPGDEVIVFEPHYLCYRNLIVGHGGKMVYVPFRIRNGTSGEYSQHWSFDRDELESKITKKTKIFWLNNPNNPTGKVCNNYLK